MPLIMNTSPMPVAINDYILPPSGEANVPDEEYEAWLERSDWHRDVARRSLTVKDGGGVQVTSVMEEIDPDDRPGLIDATIAAMLADRNEDEFTGRGLPNMAAVRQRSGLMDMTTAERDASWERVRPIPVDPPPNPEAGNGDGS